MPNIIIQSGVVVRLSKSSAPPKSSGIIPEKFTAYNTSDTKRLIKGGFKNAFLSVIRFLSPVRQYAPIVKVSIFIPTM